jgi:hypothetical protein
MKEHNKNNVTIYEDVEDLIRETLNNEETKQDKKYFLTELNRLINILLRDYED